MRSSLLRFFFLSYACCWVLPAFPTRGSSDLREAGVVARGKGLAARGREDGRVAAGDIDPVGMDADLVHTNWVYVTGGNRSEEHTSELQSLTNLVCRLLLEKKKQKKKRENTTN